MSELTDADDISLEAFYDDAAKQDWTDPAEHIDVDRWTKYGHDRLYINSGIAKADKYGLYVDLETHEVHSDNTSKHSGGDVEIEGDEAVITIEESGGDKVHEITVALEGEGFESVDDETYECEECGSEHDTEHGLAVHEGLAHGDDEDEESEDVDAPSPATDDHGRPAVADGGREDPTAEPLPEYERETTEDYRQAEGIDAAGDGEYDVDAEPGSLGEDIAAVVTRNGGRIPVDYSPRTHDEGYARERTWTVYAPASNPYHIAATVQDLLNDAEHVTESELYVEQESAREAAERLRASGIDRVFDREDEQDLIDAALRELRWLSGVPYHDRDSYLDDPSEARRRLDDRDQDPPEGSAAAMTAGSRERRIRQITEHPGDAWDYVEIEIVAREQADDPYWG